MVFKKVPSELVTSTVHHYVIDYLCSYEMSIWVGFYNQAFIDICTQC